MAPPWRRVAIAALILAFASTGTARVTAQQRGEPATGGGPVGRRLLSGDDTDQSNLFWIMPSPDGRFVACVDLVLGALHLRDLASGEEEPLLRGLPAAFISGSPVWSPDGTRLAFLERSMETDIESTKILDLASATVTPVPGRELTDPQGASVGRAPVAWFPDGHLLLYKSNGELGIVPVSGGTPRVLADSVRSASLSPDGRYVAYSEGPQGSEQIFVQPVDSGTRHQVTDEPGGNTAPMWSPDGTAIAYQRSDGIWVVPISGGDLGGFPRLGYAAEGVSPRAWTAVGGL